MKKEIAIRLAELMVLGTEFETRKLVIGTLAGPMSVERNFGFIECGESVTFARLESLVRPVLNSKHRNSPGFRYLERAPRIPAQQAVVFAKPTAKEERDYEQVDQKAPTCWLVTLHDLAKFVEMCKKRAFLQVTESRSDLKSNEYYGSVHSWTGTFGSFYKTYGHGEDFVDYEGQKSAIDHFRHEFVFRRSVGFSFEECEVLWEDFHDPRKREMLVSKKRQFPKSDREAFENPIGPNSGRLKSAWEIALEKHAV